MNGKWCIQGVARLSELMLELLAATSARIGCTYQLSGTEKAALVVSSRLPCMDTRWTKWHSWAHLGKEIMPCNTTSNKWKVKCIHSCIDNLSELGLCLLPSDSLIAMCENTKLINLYLCLFYISIVSKEAMITRFVNRNSNWNPDKLIEIIIRT